jgi:HEAT repeat protein
MITDEVLQASEDREHAGTRLNEIVDQFRRGRPIDEIMVLLDSDNVELVSIGAWILGELPLELYGDPSVISRLRQLTAHVEPMVRFHALGAVYPALDPGDPETGALIQRLLHDPNDGVRRAANAAASRTAKATPDASNRRPGDPNRG